MRMFATIVREKVIGKFIAQIAFIDSHLELEANLLEHKYLKTL